MRYLRLGLAALGFAALGVMLIPSASAQKTPAAEKSNMELVGYHDLQGRSAYQPLVHKQGDRWIAYIGHHGGTSLNPLTGKQEDNGTSILDVTNPKQPKYLAHIPGEPGRPKQAARRWCASATAATCRAPTEQGVPAAHASATRPRNLGRHRSVEAARADRRRQRPGRHAQELVGVRHRHRLPRRRRAGVAHAAHDDDLRSERSGEAGVHPRLRAAGPAAWRDRRRCRPSCTARSRPGRTGNRVYFGYGTGSNGVRADRRSRASC